VAAFDTLRAGMTRSFLFVFLLLAAPIALAQSVTEQLFAAIASGNEAEVARWIKAGVHYTARNDSGEPVIVAAAEHGRPVEPPGAAQVEILDDRVAAETGGLEVACQPAVLAVLHLPVDEQPQALLEAEVGVVGPLELVRERAGHAREGEGVELVDRGCDEHVRSPPHS